MATRKERGVTLPFASLRLLAPPTRLVSAALVKVLKQRDVMQYGVVEEFVTSACDTVPGLLTFRHQGKLTLGLRGRLILEILRTQPDLQVLEPHLKRIRAPAVPPATAAASVRNDVKIAKTVESFHLFIAAMLNDPAEKEHFFKEEFPVDYGPKFDEELEKLLWEFLIRLDQLLPIPNLAQTVSWISGAPSVLEECARSATQPQLLNILLQHQTSVGHLEPAASLPPCMGDSILQSLSLPPSGRVPSNQAPAPGRGRAAPFPKPVIGSISNKDVPVMNPVGKKAPRAAAPSSLKDSTAFTAIKDGRQKEEEEEEEEEEGSVVRRCRAKKRKHAEEESDEEAPSQDSLRSSRVQVGGGQQEEAQGHRKEELAARMAQLGLQRLRLPQDPALCSLFASCIMKQPTVTVGKRTGKRSGGGGSGGGGGAGGGGGGGGGRSLDQGTMSPVIPPMSARPERDGAGSDDKENLPEAPVLSSSLRLQRHTASSTSGANDDYVADSEDEGTKNFKGRLFMKRYCKTKHGTYVPTLREFCRPRAPRLTLLSSVSKGR